MFTSNYLKGLQAKMDALSQEDIDNNQPEGVVGEDEQVVGTVPEYLRKLRTVHSQMVDAAQRKDDEHHLSHSSPNHKEEDCVKHHQEMSPIKREVSVISNLFWMCLESDLGIDPGTSIGIRADWQVVTLPESEANGIEIQIGGSDLVGMALASMLRR